MAGKDPRLPASAYKEARIPDAGGDSMQNLGQHRRLLITLAVAIAIAAVVVLLAYSGGGGGGGGGY
jgi:hypothetical protein